MVHCTKSVSTHLGEKDRYGDDELVHGAHSTAQIYRRNFRQIHGRQAGVQPGVDTNNQAT